MFYQINMYQNVNFMHRIKIGNIPKVFYETVKKPHHKYPTTFSNLDYNIKNLIQYLKRKLSQSI